MAEILLSLTIIGVVAAITLPSLTGNINERTWNTQRKALYARFSQAIALMPALNGYGELKEASSEGASDAVDTATETFLTAGLSKVLKINNICDNAHLQDCGIVTSFTNMAGCQISMPTKLYDLHPKFKSATWADSSYSTIDSKAVAFETQNGESIIAFYNPNCRTEYTNLSTQSDYAYGFAQSNMCVNFIYDLNGNKGPNTAGKDIGIMTVFNATDSIVVAPMPSSATNAVFEGNGMMTWYNAAKACTNADSESRLPNLEELSAMFINNNIINLTSNFAFWSSKVFDADQAFNVTVNFGTWYVTNKNETRYVRCVKR